VVLLLSSKNFVTTDAQLMLHTTGANGAKLFAASGDQAASEHEQLASAAILVTSEKINWLRVDTRVSVASQQNVFPTILGLAQVAQCNKIRKLRLTARFGCSRPSTAQGLAISAANLRRFLPKKPATRRTAHQLKEVSRSHCCS
jgi:hypothetical protein